MNNKFRYAFFDFDGVIVDSEPDRLKTYKDLFLKIYDKKVEIDKYDIVGRPEDYNLRELLKFNQLNISKDVIKNLKTIRAEMLTNAASLGFPVIKKIYSIISVLKNMKIPMAIVTNSPRNYIANALRVLGIDEDNFIIITNDDVTTSKPDPEGYLKALSAFSCSCEEVLAFEDSPSGIKAASMAGIEVVAVHSTFNKSSLEAKYHLELDIMTDDVTEIVSLFGGKYA